MFQTFDRSVQFKLFSLLHVQKLLALNLSETFRALKNVQNDPKSFKTKIFQIWSKM